MVYSHILFEMLACGNQHVLPLSEPSSEPPEPLSPKPLALPAELLSEPLESPKPLALPVELLSEPDPPEREPASVQMCKARKTPSIVQTMKIKHPRLTLSSLSLRLLQWSQPNTPYVGYCRLVQPVSSTTRLKSSSQDTDWPAS